jgi:hypothetical protein
MLPETVNLATLSPFGAVVNVLVPGATVIASLGIADGYLKTTIPEPPEPPAPKAKPPPPAPPPVLTDPVVPGEEFPPAPPPPAPPGPGLV